MCIDKTSIYTVIWKSLGEWIRNPCELQGKNLLYTRLRRGSNLWRSITQDSESNTLPTELFWPRICLDNSTCLLVGCLTSQQHATVSLERICSDNFTCCHTEIEVADPTSISPSHSILTPGRPVPVLTLSRQAPGRVATGVPMFKSLVWLYPEKNPSASGIRTRDLPLSRRTP